ncbi:unnamed protein product [Caenorhabditis brenneri]
MTNDAVKSFTAPLRRIRGLESVSEKLIQNTTIGILVFLFVLFSSKLLFGSPISCQVPKDWPNSAVDYFNDVCYFGKREKVAFKQTLNRGHKRGAMSVNTMTGTSDFYMWVPYMPILHGTLCLLPVLFWKFLGLDCFNGLDILAFLEFFESEDKEVLMNSEEWRVQKLASQIHEWILAKRESVFGLSRTLLLYVLMKWFRFSIFVFQFWMIATIFGGGNFYWGYDSIVDIVQGRTINKLQGEFTLISGCRVGRFTMGIDKKHTSSNLYESHARLVSFCSAVHHTMILLVPVYRRYEISSMIRCESYYIKRYGGPHPDLHMTTANPIDHLIDYLGNDGFLVVRMVYDMLHHYACDRLIEYVWAHEISRCDEKILIEVRKKSKIVDNSVVIDTEMDGGGDRHRGGYDHPEKKKLLSSVEPNDSVSCAKFSLSRESQPSLMLSESDEDPLLSPTLFNSLS